MPRSLYVLLEGPDDQRFFEQILKHEFLKKYDKIMPPYLYAKMSKKSIGKLLNALNKGGREYIIFSDLDTARCVTEKKESLIKTNTPKADPAKIAIVKLEIESWYLAGLKYSDARKLQLPPRANTEDISKELFNQNMTNKFSSRIDFMQEILKYFNANTAKKQNDSFRYMWHKFIS